MNIHCVKSVGIRSFSGTYFPAFGLNTEYLSVFSLNAGKYGPEKLQIRWSSSVIVSIITNQQLRIWLPIYDFKFLPLWFKSEKRKKTVSNIVTVTTINPFALASGANTDLPSNSIISKTIGVTIAFTRKYFKECSINFLMIRRMIDFTLVVFYLLMFKICGMIGFLKIMFFKFSVSERVKFKKNKNHSKPPKLTSQ